MATYITLEEAKDHLRVDFDDDDRYIETLCDVAEASLESNLGITLDNLVLSGSLSDLPADVKHAGKLLLSHFYEVREPVMVGTIVSKLPYSVTYLLAAHKYWTIG